MKNVFKISASILLCISLAGCGAKQSLENNEPEQKYEDIEGPGKDFDWNAKVSPFDTKQTYEEKSGEENTSKSAAVLSKINRQYYLQLYSLLNHMLQLSHMRFH